MLTMAQMPYIIGHKVRIYPSDVQKRIIAVNDGVNRFIYNKLVERHNELHQLSKVNTYLKVVEDRKDYLRSLGEKATDFKAVYSFLEEKDVDGQAIENAKRHYSAAWNNFKKVPGTSIHTYHKKDYEKSYQTNAHYKNGDTLIGDGNVYLTDSRHIMLPKLGRIKFKDSGRLNNLFKRLDETRIGTITISMNAAGEYYASFQIGSVAPFVKPATKTGAMVGIDMNVSNFCTDSNGIEVENPKFKRKAQDHLAKLQKKVSRKCERAKKEHRSLHTAKNYQKARKALAKEHLHIARRREDFLHVQSKDTVDNQDFIFTEDLKVKNLLKNHKLAYSISDCSWSRYFQMLQYKSELYGKTYVKVPAKNTSQTCSNCGFTLTGDNKLTLNNREWICPNCGTYHHRDENAAVNILNRGMDKLKELGLV